MNKCTKAVSAVVVIGAIVFTQPVLASDFCDGYQKGYAEAYKDKYGNYPNRPNCPNLPNSAQGQSMGDRAYSLGYRLGVQEGSSA